METKYCKKCDTHKTLDQFNKDKQTKDGLQYYCRECRRKECKDIYYFKNPQELKFCEDCGTKIGYVHKLIKYCEDCRKERDRKHSAEWAAKKYEQEPDYIRARLRVWRRRNKQRAKELSARAYARRKGHYVPKILSKDRQELLSLPSDVKKQVIIERTNEKLKKYFDSQIKKG